MDIRKHAATAAIAIVCGALAGAASHRLLPAKERIIVEKVRVAAAKHAWPDLTMDETIAIGEAMKDPLKGVSVSIFCTDSSCDDLAHDLDDAMQIADVGSSLEKSVTSLGQGFYIVGRPGDKRAEALAASIDSATAGKLKPTTKIGSDVVEGALLVAIGSRPR